MSAREIAFNVSGVTGWDWLAWKLLPERAFARRVARKLAVSQSLAPDAARFTIGLPSGASYRVEGGSVTPCARVAPF